ncbi:UDP-3-O-acyl-N-acetylglucosamine deacetylase [bacterium]|nr:UDP-3-O-acyl-N-acetylglucosamine deacetylase [bacterium]
MSGNNVADRSTILSSIIDEIALPERTLAGAVSVRGIGFVHGQDVTVQFRPAPAGTGIVFVRTDLPNKPSVPARFEFLLHQNRRTAIGRGNAIIEMTEHLLAPLAALGITSAYIDIDSDETPAGDGSSQVYLDAIDRVGTRTLDANIAPVIIREPIRINEGIDEGTASIEIRPPSIRGLRITYDLAYDHPGIGEQTHTEAITASTFRQEIAAARTFVLEQEVSALRSMGIGLRQTSRDLLVYRADGSIIENNLRYPNECARHKLLDVVGDLALLGRPIWGDLHAKKSGHRHNVALVKSIFEHSVQHPGGSVSVRNVA